MGRAVTLAACALNQWALDFEGNLERIFRSEWGGGTPLPLSCFPPSLPLSARLLETPGLHGAVPGAGPERPAGV